MTDLIVGVGQVTLYFRHSRSLKDKRQSLKGIIQKLRNMGFSVTEAAYSEDPKRGNIGFGIVGKDAPFVQRSMEEGLRLFIGDFEILQTRTDTFDYSEKEIEDLSEVEDNQRYWGDS